MAQHPVYKKLKEQQAADGRTPFLDTADAAKCMRTVLKARFPGCKFSVRIDRYAGGSSVRVNWTDGPTEKMVNAICGQYEGKSFDGSIDMAYYNDCYLMPDGSAAFAQTDGTAGSMGYVQAAKAFKPDPDAIRVSPTCYVFCKRSHSLEHMQRTLKSYAAKWPGCELSDAIESGEIAVVEDEKFGGWKYKGDPYAMRDCPGDYRGYGGDSALYQLAARRVQPGFAA